MTRLPDAEIDQLWDLAIKHLPTEGLTQLRSLALEVRERRAAERSEKAEREAEDRESDEQWARIKAMTPEQLDATLTEAGFDLADVKREASHTKKWCDALIREKERTAKAEAELAQLRARVVELETERSNREDAEASRWQERIADTIERAGLDPWDASGNDSGDPLDWTDDQVGYAIRDARLAALRECHAALMSSDAPLKAIGLLIEESE